MELSKFKERSHTYTEKASVIARQINFAGIGIIWIITTTNGIVITSSSFVYPLFLISVALIFDFFQYLLGGVLWITFYNSKIKAGNTNSTEVTSEPWRKRILYTIYYIKFILTFIGYLFIAIALFKYL